MENSNSKGHNKKNKHMLMFKKCFNITLYLLVVICAVLFIKVSTTIINSLSDEKTNIEYVYKDFSNNDIERAMRFHGTGSVIITSIREPYFINKDGVEVNLFTDACLEHLIELKREGLNQERKERDKKKWVMIVIEEY